MQGEYQTHRTLNPYIYVLNNPLGYLDSNGEVKCGAGDLVCQAGDLVDSAFNGGVSWYNGLDPDSQQLISLTAMIVLTVATGGLRGPGTTPCRRHRVRP